MRGTAGQLAAIAREQGARLTCILVSEVHPGDLPQDKSAWELAEYKASKVREFLGPDADIYYDLDQGAEHALEFTTLNLVYIEDGRLVYRMTPIGQEGEYRLGITPFLSWWRNTYPSSRTQ